MFRPKHLSYQSIGSDVELSNVPSNPFLDTIERQSSITTVQQTWRQRHFTGWRMGIFTGAAMATGVLILNLAVTISALSRQRVEDAGRRLLFEGDCHEAERLNVIAHLLINAMSTILLSASNYGMQVLSAPTRSEIDVAHSKRKWLDIGVLSVRNIRNISPKRAWLWCALGASSLPLHLLYNSAVFSTVTAHEYVILSARQDMITPEANGTTFGVTSNGLSSKISMTDADEIVSEMVAKALNGTLERLTASQCIQAYAITFQTDYRHLFLVTNQTGPLADIRVYNNFDSAITPGSVRCMADPFDWICSQDAAHGCMSTGDVICPVKYKSIDPNNWEPMGQVVDHCLAERLPGNCKVQFSTTIAWVVIVFNTSKALILISIWLFLGEDPLTTMGDAVASFMRMLDETTAGLCLMSRDRIAHWKTLPHVPLPYSSGVFSNSRRWSHVVSKPRWWFCMWLYIFAIGVCVFLFFYGIFGKPVPSNMLISLPIGSLSPTAFIYGWSIPSAGNAGVIGNVLIANLPQVILSMIYYTYNSLFTCFLAGREWSSYARTRKGLRVSAKPKGQQRSTYFLQLPYRVAFPLMILSGALHWLTSQSIFLVSVQEQVNGTPDNDDEFLTCGYSPPAILAVIIIGCFMVAIVSFFGTRTFKGGMPIVATSSACISAHCHLPERERDIGAEFRKVRWGVTDEIVDYDQDKGITKAISHCSFSCQAVRMPDEGEMCAGLAR